MGRMSLQTVFQNCSRLCAARRLLGSPSQARHGVRELRTTSLAEAVRRSSEVEELDLSGGTDLVCTNLMCDKVGEACICRLAAVLERLPRLRSLNLSGSRLEGLPDSLWQLASLEELDLSGNKLTTISAKVTQLSNLRKLNLSNNTVTVPRDLWGMPNLKNVDF